MTASASARNRAAMWLAFLAILLGIGLSQREFRQLLGQALRELTVSAVAVTLPLQFAAVLTCGLALWVLKPGVGFGASLLSRMLRDAAGSVLAFLPGLAEAVGARALVLSGGTVRTAIAASALDKLAEGIAQLPFIAFAGWILWHGFGDRPIAAQDVLWLALVGFALIGAAFLAVRLGRGWGPVARLREQLATIAQEARGRMGRMPVSTALHFLAWLSGGVQLWFAGRALGYDIGFYEGLALESTAYAARSLAFVVPAGLGAQEGAMVAAGLALGLAAPQSLALGLVLRLRDVVFGLPLIAWPIYEMRHARRRATAPEG